MARRVAKRSHLHLQSAARRYDLPLSFDITNSNQAT
jgi:hypothetical protein